MEQLTLEQLFHIQCHQSDDRIISSDFTHAIRAVEKQYKDNRFYYEFEMEGKEELLDFYQTVRHFPSSILFSDFRRVPSVYENSRTLYEKTLHLYRRQLTDIQNSQIDSIIHTFMNPQKDYACINLYGVVSHEYEYQPWFDEEKCTALAEDIRNDLIRLIRNDNFSFGIIHYEQENEETAFAMFIKIDDYFAKLSYSLLRESGLLMKLSLSCYGYQKDIPELPFSDLTEKNHQTLVQYFKEKIREGMHPKTTVLYALDAVMKRVNENHAYYLHTEKGMEEMIDLYQYYVDTIEHDLIYRLSIRDVYRQTLPKVIALAKDTLIRYGQHVYSCLDPHSQLQIGDIIHTFVSDDCQESSICFHGTFSFEMYYNREKQDALRKTETENLLKAYLCHMIFRCGEGVGSLVRKNRHKESVCYLAINEDGFVQLNDRSVRLSKMNRGIVHPRIRNEIHIASLENIIF